jgi:hypothetical protein
LHKLQCKHWYSEGTEKDQVNISKKEQLNSFWSISRRVLGALELCLEG